MHSTRSHFTLKEVVDFCWANKKRRAFKGYNYTQVCKIVVIAARGNMLELVEDDLGLCGVLIWRVSETQIFVDFLITVRAGFKTFVDFYKRTQLGKEVLGQRDGKVVVFSQRILCQQLHQN